MGALRSRNQSLVATSAAFLHDIRRWSRTHRGSVREKVLMVGHAYKAATSAPNVPIKGRSSRTHLLGRQSTFPIEMPEMRPACRSQLPRANQGDRNGNSAAVAAGFAAFAVFTSPRLLPASSAALSEPSRAVAGLGLRRVRNRCHHSKPDHPQASGRETRPRPHRPSHRTVQPHCPHVCGQPAGLPRHTAGYRNRFGRPVQVCRRQGRLAAPPCQAWPSTRGTLTRVIPFGSASRLSGSVSSPIKAPVSPP